MPSETKKRKVAAAAEVPSERRIEYMPLGALKAAKNNPKRHASEDIGKSIGRFGYVEPLVIDERTKRLVAGHGRLGTLQARRDAGEPPPDGVRAEGGEWLVPVLRGWGSKNDADAEAFLVATNRLVETGRWDDEKLTELLENLGEVGLPGTGYSPEDLLEMLSGRQTFTAEKVPVASLKPHPRNYQAHPEDQLNHIIESIKLHGFYRNVVVARDNTILAGHGVVEAAKKMGERRIPVIRLDLDPNEARALKVLTSDNEIGNLAQTDDRALTELLKGIMEDGGLLGTGFDEAQLAALTYVTRPASEVGSINEAEAWVGMPEYEEGGTPYKLVITFQSPEDRVAFSKKIKLRIDKNAIKGTTWSTRWPWTDRESTADIRFMSGMDESELESAAEDAA